MRPDEQRHPPPVHPWRTHLVDGDDEVQTGQDGRESADENTDGRRHHICVRVSRTEWRIEGPPGIDASRYDGAQRRDSRDDVDIPTQQVDTRECQVART